MIKRILLSLVLFFITMTAYTSDYLCPRTPLKVTIGTNINEDWHIWPENKTNNKLTRLYYKSLKVEYQIKSWSEYPSGKHLNHKGKFINNFIACCQKIKNEKICAYKYIVENDCKFSLLFPAGEKFSCVKKNLGNNE